LLESRYCSGDIYKEFKERNFKDGKFSFLKDHKKAVMDVQQGIFIGLDLDGRHFSFS
jgi:hypothetical protein